MKDNQKIEVTKVQIEDLQQLRDFSEKTFIQAYLDSNSAESLREYVENNFTTVMLKKELLNTSSQFYFAAYMGELAGYLKVNCGQAQKEFKQESSLEIERIYVLKEFQGKGIGRVLLEKAINTAREEKANFIWLGVWEHNPEAISFYLKSGFKIFDKRIFMLGEEKQLNDLMRLDL